MHTINLKLLVLNGKTRGKELKRAKQAGQQRASGSDCNLAVNRTLTTNHVLPAWVGIIWLRRRTTTSDAMNCCVGVSASSNRVRARRPGRFRWSFMELLESSRWWSSSSNSVHVDATRPEKSSDVEQQRPRSGQTCGKVRKGVERITTQLNSTTSDNVLTKDFIRAPSRIVLVVLLFTPSNARACKRELR